MVSDKIAARFDDQALWLGLTYSAHPVSSGSFKIYEHENMIANAAEMGEYIERRVMEMQGFHPSIGDFRNTGLFGCIELVKNRDSKEPMAPYNAKTVGNDYNE